MGDVTKETDEVTSALSNVINELGPDAKEDLAGTMIVLRNNVRASLNRASDCRVSASAWRLNDTHDTVHVLEERAAELGANNLIDVTQLGRLVKEARTVYQRSLPDTIADILAANCGCRRFSAPSS